MLCSDADAGSEHGHSLHIRRKWAHEVDTSYGKQFTDLLEADLGLTARHDGADTLALNSAALRQNIIGDPQLLKQFRRQIRSADARRVRDRLGL